MGLQIANLLLLKNILENAAAEMTTIGEIASRVEESLFEWQKHIKPDAQVPASFQDFDLLIQKLIEISLFLDRLSEHVDTNAVVTYSEVISPIRLASLKEALVRRQGRPAFVRDMNDPLDVDFFDT